MENIKEPAQAADELVVEIQHASDVPAFEKPVSSIAQSALYSTFYCVVSVGMVSVNKLVVSNYDFNFISFLLLLQSIATIALIGLLGQTPKFDKKAAYRLIPLSLVYLANVQVGLLAVRLLSVPVYTVIKRLTPFPTMCLDYLVRSKAQPLSAIAGVLLLILGPLLVAKGDLDFNPLGYAMGLLAVGVQSLFLVGVSWNRDLGFSEMELSWYNSVLTVPPLVLGVLMFETDATQHIAWSQAGFVVSLISFAMLGAVFLFSTILLTSRCSGLTLTVVGQAKGLVQLYVGFLWFGEVRLMQEGFVGIAMSTLGALMYAWAKLKGEPKSK